MVRRRVQLGWLAFFTASVMLLPAAAEQPATAALTPRSQLLGARAFSAVRPFKTDGLARSLQTAAAAAPAPFTYLLLRWRASGAGQVDFAVRASRDGRSWTTWADVGENEDLHDGRAPDVHWGGVLHTGLARFWQLRVRLSPGADGVTPAVREVRVDTVDARGGGQPRPAVVDAKQTSGPPGFVSREVWGGSTVVRNSRAPRWYPANHLIVHHSADPNSLRPREATWADRVRAEWAFHRYQRGWGDLGYNWLIDPDGVIYEGRSGSADPARDAVGVHDTANEGSMSVVLLGTFGPRTSLQAMMPTAAAQDALVRLLAWKVGQRGIDPFGSSRYEGCATSNACARVHPGGVVKNIAGHRDVLAGRSGCPGDLAMDVLPSIRSRVAQALAASAAGDPPLAAPAEPVAPGASVTPTPLPTMPNLTGLGETQAKQALARLGIYMVIVDYQGRDRLGVLYDQFPPYAVVSHLPPPGAVARPGMLVKLGIRAP